MTWITVLVFTNLLALAALFKAERITNALMRGVNKDFGRRLIVRVGEKDILDQHIGDLIQMARYENNENIVIQFQEEGHE